MNQGNLAPRHRGRSQHTFAQIPRADIQRSTFNRSCGVKTGFDAGYLIPIFMDEALPGDTFSMKAQVFSRISTLEFPIMDNVYLDFFFFAVPNRLLWANWEKFNGAQDNPADSTDFVVPYMDSTAVTGYAEESIHDYMGIPPGVPDLRHSALWHRAYNLIWNEWFRDENLQDSETVTVGDGPDSPTAYALLKRGKRHDYFTSCLPWPQKGDAVELPLGDSAPVVGEGTGLPTFTADLGGYNIQSNGVTQAVSLDGQPDGTYDLAWDDTALEADLSSATAATINSLRQAFQIQRLYERDARGGTRYTEILRSHFGVVSPDQRLQRPEYLGGGSSPVMITPIAQTAPGTSPVTKPGLLWAAGAAFNQGIRWTKSFTEHCTLLGLVAARCDLNYQQGLDRMWSRSTRWDFYWPALAHLGEQAVLNKEIYAQGSDGGTDDAGVFGYQERYAEYRYKPSIVTGKFRSQATASLDAWHCAQEFGSLPVLNDSFIQENPPLTRNVIVNTEPQFLMDAHYTLKCARPMPTYSVPGLIDHF